MNATREALLDAAETLLAKHGVAGASARDITKEAGANLGAINYHFGSKDNLVLEVFARRMRPMNQERIAQLDRLENSSGPEGPKLEKIVEVLVRPVVVARESQGKEFAIMQLICRGFQEANPAVKAFLEREFAEIAERFDNAFLKAVPGLAPEEVYWRMKFLGGAMNHGLDVWSRFDDMPHPNPKVQPVRLDREAFIQRLVAFVSAGISATLPAKS
ncbi:MAG: TetR/AcrR family transcriptional regulator [Roseimicrobium sp.]